MRSQPGLAAIALFVLVTGGCRVRVTPDEPPPSATATDEVAAPAIDIELPLPLPVAPPSPAGDSQGGASAVAPVAWSPLVFAHIGFGPATGIELAEEAASQAREQLNSRSPVDALSSALQRIESSPLTQVGPNAPHRKRHVPQKGALVMDSLVGSGAVTLLEGDFSPVDVASRLVSKRGLRLLGPAAIARLRLAQVPTPAGRETELDAGSPAPRVTAFEGDAAILMRTADGRFAGAVSDGGDPERMIGEISARSVPGIALYCGPLGGVLISWAGRAQPNEPLARLAYSRLETGEAASAVSEWALSAFKGSFPDQRVGVVVLTEQQASVQGSDWVYALSEEQKEQGAK